MSIRNKYLLYGLGTIILVFLVCIIAYLIRGDTFGVNYTTELRIESTDGISEVKVSSKDMCKYLFKDGVLIRRITSIPKAYTTPVMEMPVAKETFDIENKQEQVSEMTWESDLQNSSNYIQYLTLSGYTTTLAIYTPDNIELFLDKGTIRKRVVIFKESIMIGEVLKDYELPTLESYLK